jgi:hypothetical protein
MVPLTREAIAEVVFDVTDDEAAATHRTVQRIFSLWGIDPSVGPKLVGLTEPSAGFSDEAKLRLVCFMRIHFRLRQIFGLGGQAYSWMKLPNTAFQGASALEVIERDLIDGLVRVCVYLESIGAE